MTGQATAGAGHTEQVRTLFDGKAASWSGKYAPEGRLAGRLAQLAAAVQGHVAAGAHLVDLGCGTGDLARHLAASGFRPAGFDIAPQMLSHAAAADPDGTVSWVQIDPRWRTLPLATASVDAVVAASVLEYVQRPATVLSECARVLRPGGVLLCTVPDVAHPVRWLEWLLIGLARIPLTRHVLGASPRMRRYLTYLEISRQRRTARWWRDTASEAGLTAIAHPGRRSPLRLLVFIPTDDTRERP